MGTYRARKLCPFCCEIDAVPRSVPPLIRCFGAQGPSTAGLKIFVAPADSPSYCLQHCHREKSVHNIFLPPASRSLSCTSAAAAEVAAVPIDQWDSGISSDSIHWHLNNSLFPLKVEPNPGDTWDYQHYRGRSPHQNRKTSKKQAK